MNDIISFRKLKTKKMYSEQQEMEKLFSSKKVNVTTLFCPTTSQHTKIEQDCHLTIAPVSRVHHFFRVLMTILYLEYAAVLSGTLTGLSSIATGSFASFQ